MTPEELAKAIGSFLNTNSLSGLNELVDCLMREHPTLQQRFTLLVDKWFEKQAEDHHHDLRTQATVTLAEHYVANIHPNARYIPCI